MPVFSRFLRYFLAVAQHGSIRRASEHLRIAASAIDRQILQGEESLGTPLFERLPTGLRLTATGELLYAHGKQWSRDLTNMCVQIEDMRGLRRGQVDIAVPDALTRGFLPRLLRAMRTTHPGITICTHVLDNSRIQNTLIDGSVDLALLLNPTHARGLLVRAHKDFPLGFVCLPNHPVAERKSARFSLAMNYPMIMPEPPLALHRQIDILQIDSNLNIHAAASSDNIQMIKSLVREGIGLGILSALDVMEEVTRGELAFIPISNHDLAPLTLALCVDHSRQLSGAARLVISELEKEFLSPTTQPHPAT
ncbi:MAG: LysR family transcriptional regulator [Gluconobacter sp.]|uniref:LysR family transcriptional regulator n=1 Tax=Gluconobacter sp. TaxID=1876758 RepID=UPI0039E9551F